MNKACFNLWLNRLAWSILVFDLITLLIIPVQFHEDIFILMLLYLLWLITSLCGAITWLMIRWERLFRSWLGWLIPLLAMVISNPFVAGVWAIHNERNLFIIMILSIASTWAIGPATAILLYHRDIGVGLLGWGLVVFTWTAFFSWRAYGNVIEIMFLSVNDTGTVSPLWPLNPFICLFWWVLPFSLISFIYHTVRYMMNEQKRIHPQKPVVHFLKE